MQAKHTISELAPKRTQLNCLRRKVIKIRPLHQQQECQSPLLSATFLQQQPIQINNMREGAAKEHQLKEKSEQSYEKMNKIYNKSDKKIQSLGSSGKAKLTRASVNYLNSPISGELGFQGIELRPKSSNNKKFLPANQIFRNNNDLLNYQKRPGSSKSSRLFKRKQPMQTDPVNTQNEECELIIRVTSMGGSRLKNNKYLRDNRVSTSLNPSERNEKLPTKLDPEFYKLFAK